MSIPRRSVPGNRWDRLDGEWPAHPPSISVVVVHYEQPGPLRRTLAALRDQTHPVTRTEIIVVDDGSTDAPAIPTEVRLLRQSDRGARPGPARNLGIEAASGEIVCFLDADTSPEPDYLRRLTRLPTLLDDAVTVGRRRHADFSRLGPDAVATEGARVELSEPRWLRDGYAASRDLLDADDRAYRFVISSVLAARRDFIRDTGPFAAFDAYGGEDWEWAHRAWRNGAVLAHVPDAVAWHDGPEWSARADGRSRRRIKNAETIRLARLIGVPGSRGHALSPDRAEIVARLHGPASAAAAFLTVDSLLDALPETVVLVEPELAAVASDARLRAVTTADDEALRWPRLWLDLHAPAEYEPGRVRALCERVAGGDPARLTLGDGTGPLLTVTQGRAAARARRRQTEPTTEHTTAAGQVARLDEAEPDLEAWVGGWTTPRFAGPPGR